MKPNATTLLAGAIVVAGVAFNSIYAQSTAPLSLGSDAVGSMQLADAGASVAGDKQGVKQISVPGAGPLPALGQFPSLDGAVGWLNSNGLTAADLKGKVVLVNFWTYACGDCVSALPTIERWAHKYKDQGLVVIGVHSPEFAFEKRLASLKRAVASNGIKYPVAIDNDYKVWKAFNNNYWPEQYVIDVQGLIRYHHLGADSYENTEAVMEAVLQSRRDENATNQAAPEHAVTVGSDLEKHS